MDKLPTTLTAEQVNDACRVLGLSPADLARVDLRPDTVVVDHRARLGDHTSPIVTTTIPVTR